VGEGDGGSDGAGAGAGPGEASYPAGECEGQVPGRPWLPAVLWEAPARLRTSARNKGGARRRAPGVLRGETEAQKPEAMTGTCGALPGVGRSRFCRCR
jgi:hypothetical protein